MRVKLFSLVNGITLIGVGAVLLDFFFTGRLDQYLHPQFRPWTLVAGVLFCLTGIVYAAAKTTAQRCVDGECVHQNANSPVRAIVAFFVLFVPLIDDPHWWNSVANVEKATVIVRDELIKLDPANRAAYDSNAKSYLAKLGELDKWVKRKVAELPRDKRKLVTSHDAFQYLAKDYGFRVYAIEGVSTETEPSNRHVAELIDEIKKQQVKAIFLENTLNPKVTVEITKETGAKIGGTLYADGLGGLGRG